MAEVLLTDGLCQKLKMSAPVLRELRRKGLPCFKVGRSYRYIESDVIDWLKAQKASGEGE